MFENGKRDMQAGGDVVVERSSPRALPASGVVELEVGETAAPALTTSVVIPAYNAAAYLKETLDSVAAQTCPPDEVIVVDDGSSDETSQIAAAHPIVTRCIRRENGGMCAARNDGIERASSDLVFLLDSDDIWHPRHVERLTHMMAEHSNAVFGFAEYTAWPCHAQERPEFEPEPNPQVDVLSLADYVDRTNRGRIVLPSFQVFRASALAVLGDRPYREDHWQAESLFVNGLIGTYGPIVRHAGQLGLYRLHRTQVTADEYASAESILPCIEDLLLASCGGLGLDLEIRPESQRILRRHVRRWYCSAGRRLGGCGDRAAARRAFRRALRLGDLKSAAFLACSFVPGLESKVWNTGWRNRAAIDV